VKDPISNFNKSYLKVHRIQWQTRHNMAGIWKYSTTGRFLRVTNFSNIYGTAYGISEKVNLLLYVNHFFFFGSVRVNIKISRQISVTFPCCILIFFPCDSLNVDIMFNLADVQTCHTLKIFFVFAL
jgi:hypothetical protein